MTAPGAPAASFEEHFAREIVHSERLRVGMLAAVIAVLLLFLGGLYLRFHDTYAQDFGRPATARKFALILFGLLCYEFVVFRVLSWRQRSGRSMPAPLRYVNALVETSVPSLLIYIVALDTNPVFVLQSGAALLYGVFIVLSTLRLDFRLSVFTGAIACVEYVALCTYYAELDLMPDAPFDQPPFYLAKGAILLLSGFAAGFVAVQLKRRAGNAFRTMQERQRILDAFGQQVSPAIAEELIRAGPGIASRRAEVCVMFMDIRGFTRLVGNWPPERIVALQNAVFGAAVEVVSRNHGIINQFLGDGFMATFGAPTSTGRDSANALAAAREMVAAVRALAEAGRIPPIEIGIGLHAGEAVTGNIGTEQRQQYSITGDVVILASRIEQLNKEFGSQVLASREVLESAGGIPPEAVPLGPVKVKGREQPIEIYRLA
jgi:adenylate cyclase